MIATSLRLEYNDLCESVTELEKQTRCTKFTTQEWKKDFDQCLVDFERLVRRVNKSHDLVLRKGMWRLEERLEIQNKWINLGISWQWLKQSLPSLLLAPSVCILALSNK